MNKPATTDQSCQPQVAIQLPLPLLSSLKAVKEGFFELCIRVGEQALYALMEQDRTELCGTKWSRDSSRRAVRGGSTSSEITLGGRRRPQVAGFEHRRPGAGLAELRLGR
jgi:hypothetical protein